MNTKGGRMRYKRPKSGGLVTLALCLMSRLSAQVLVEDQASGTTNEIVTTSSRIPDNQLAQSFTPSLSAVGFVQFSTTVFQDNNGAGVTFTVNLRDGAYNGP